MSDIKPLSVINTEIFHKINYFRQKGKLMLCCSCGGYIHEISMSKMILGIRDDDDQLLISQFNKLDLPIPNHLEGCNETHSTILCDLCMQDPRVMKIAERQFGKYFIRIIKPVEPVTDFDYRRTLVRIH